MLWLTSSQKSDHNQTTKETLFVPKNFIYFFSFLLFLYFISSVLALSLTPLSLALSLPSLRLAPCPSLSYSYLNPHLSVLPKVTQRNMIILAKPPLWKKDQRGIWVGWGGGKQLLPGWPLLHIGIGRSEIFTQSTQEEMRSHNLLVWVYLAEQYNANS